MAGSYDRNWRVGGKSRGTRSQFRLEGLQPFRCTYPVYLTDMMDVGQSTQAGFQRTDFATSPFKETRTRAVREYEQTIDQLRKENFDLKLKIFLTEEENKKKYHNKGDCDDVDETDDTIQVIVNLRVETETLRKELDEKDQALQNALEEVEKSVLELNEKDQELQIALEKAEKIASELKSLQDTQEELKTLLKQYPTVEETMEMQEQYSELISNNEYLKSLADEKTHEIEEVNKSLKELEVRNKALEEKVYKSSQAIRGCVMRYQEDINMPSDIRTVVKAAVEAAQHNNKKDMVSAVENLQLSLCQIMPEPSNVFNAKSFTNYSLEDSQMQASSSNNNETYNTESTHRNDSRSIEVDPRHQDTELPSVDDSGKLSMDYSKDDLNEIPNTSVESSYQKSDLKEYSKVDLESVNEILNENQSLKQRIEEKSEIISNLTSACTELEKRGEELKLKLEDAYSKVELLGLESADDITDTDLLSKGDASAQTDIQWHFLQSKISDKNLQDFGNSENIEELKEEILMLILAIEQKDKELTDCNEKLISLKNDAKNNFDVKVNNTLANVNEDFSTERDELQRRLAISCSVNNELLKHLQSLERFMEDLLHQKNMSTSSLENINETPDFYSQLSKCLDESLKLSHVLSDQLSICEGSKIFEPSDVTLSKEEFDISEMKSYGRFPESRFSQTESDILSTNQEGMSNFYPFSEESNKNSLVTGKRRLPFSTMQKDSTIADPENVVVLKTSNNEDLILLLNERGDPEDVLIRSNHSLLDKNNYGDQLRRRCWDTSMNNNIWNSEKFTVAHQYKENLFNIDQLSAFKPGDARYNSWMSSDSDTWSEPDRNVSMQRIGIDIQTSPVTSKSPRRSRFKDRKMTEDSTKNESATSYVKLHSWSRRRRCSEASKMSFVCKKCQRHSIQADDLLREYNSKINIQEIEDLQNKNTEHQKELDSLYEVLKDKKSLIESLNKEKQELNNHLTNLKEELEELKRNNSSLISNNQKSLNELAEKDTENHELKDIIEVLEKKASDSDTLSDELRSELSQTKERLFALDANLILKQELNNHLIRLKEELVELKRNNSSLISKNQKSLNELAEKDTKNNELEDVIEVLEKKAADSDILCDGLRSELSQTKERLFALDTKCSEWEDKLTSCLKDKEKCEEKILTLENKESELLAEIEELASQKNSLSDILKGEVEAKRELEYENWDLRNKLDATKKQVSTLQSTNKELESEKGVLLNEKTSSEVCLVSSRSECEGLNFKVKTLKESLENLKSKCDSYEKNIDVLSSTKRSIVEKLLNLEDEFISNLNMLSMINGGSSDSRKKHFYDSYDENVQVELDDGKIDELMTQISSENLKLKELISNVNQKLHDSQVQIEEMKLASEEESQKALLLEQQLELKEDEMKSLKENVNLLENNIEELKSSTMKSSATEEMQRHQISHILQELQETEKEISTLSEENHRLKESVEGIQNDLTESKKSLESRDKTINSLQKNITSFEKTIGKNKTLLKSKNEEISKLQERVFSLQIQINDLLNTKINTSANSPLKLTGNSSKILTSSDNFNARQVSSDTVLQYTLKSSFDLDSGSLVTAESSKNGQSLLNSGQQKDHDQCIAKIKILQDKVEMLEKEKANLRENLLAYVRGSKRSSSSEESTTNEKIAELESKLETKQSFLKELKSDLYKAHDSLIDKQKEIDKLKRELIKHTKIAKQNSKSLHHNIPASRVSDTFLNSTETNIGDLRKQKHELVDSLLNLQKQFYEAKNIHLRHFEKFNDHINSLRSLQISPSLLKSESAPLLNSSLPTDWDNSRKWNRNLKDTQIDLEIDIEYLQNLRIFLKRFFSPIMLQSCESPPKNVSRDNSPGPGGVELPKKRDASTQAVVQDKSDFEANEVPKPLEKFSESIELLRSAGISSHDRLTSTASNISQKLDLVESVLKSVGDDFHHINETDYSSNDTSRKTAAKSLLTKLYEGLHSFQESAEELFYLNSALKSLELFDVNLPQSTSKQDISDRESLLSEETITLSRSESISPVSFDEHFPLIPMQRRIIGRNSVPIHSYSKESKESERLPLKPSHKLISSSQDSVFQRSHYSSPDLGIESDPNHEHSAPEQLDKFHPAAMISQRHDLSASSSMHKLFAKHKSSIYSISNSSLKLNDENLSFTIGDTLHAIGVLEEYELLKKEVAESLVGIKSVLSRTGDGLHHIASYTSPRKKLEYNTFKAIKDTCLNIEVCLQKAHKLVQNFWVAPCPSEEELKLFLRHNEELNARLKRLYDSKKKQEKDFKDVLERLKQAEIIKEQQEQKISKKLVKTKKILRLAEKKILETKNTELPLLAKRSSKMPIN